MNGQELAAATMPGQVSVGVPGDVFSMGSQSGSTGQPPIDHWREDTFQQALEEFNWVFPEPEFSLNVSTLSRIQKLSYEQNFSPLMTRIEMASVYILLCGQKTQNHCLKLQAHLLKPSQHLKFSPPYTTASAEQT